MGRFADVRRLVFRVWSHRPSFVHPVRCTLQILYRPGWLPAWTPSNLFPSTILETSFENSHNGSREIRDGRCLSRLPLGEITIDEAMREAGFSSRIESDRIQFQAGSQQTPMSHELPLQQRVRAGIESCIGTNSYFF